MTVVVAAVLSLLAGSVAGAKYDLSLTTDTSLDCLGTFGFTGGGKSHFRLKVTRFELPGAAAGDGEELPAGFVVQRVARVRDARKQPGDLGNECFPHDASKFVNVTAECHFPFQKPKGADEDVLLDREINEEIDEGGFYALFLYNCRRGSVAMSIHVEQWNVVNGKDNFLSVGDMPLPVLYQIFGVLYVVMLGAWGAVLYRGRSHCHSIHYLMLGVDALKFANMEASGVHNFWDIPYDIFLMLKGCMLFVVILLIGTGWSFVKPFLSEKDKRVLIVVLPLQVIVNVAMVFVDHLHEGNPAWTAWSDVLWILDIVCCCAILLPIIWSIRTLRDASQTDGKSRRSFVRLRQFRTFYFLVVVYIYLTRIVIRFVGTELRYRVTWVSPLLLEMVVLLFYVFVGVRFRPMVDHPYLSMDEEAEEGAPHEMLERVS